jgi:hypothetical protein
MMRNMAMAIIENEYCFVAMVVEIVCHAEGNVVEKYLIRWWKRMSRINNWLIRGWR